MSQNSPVHWIGAVSMNPGVVWFLLYEPTCRFLFSLEIVFLRTIHHGEIKFSLKTFIKDHVFHRNSPHGNMFEKKKDMNNMSSCKITEMSKHIHELDDTY